MFGKKIVFILISFLFLIQCSKKDVVESEIDSGQIVWITQYSIPFIDGKTGGIISETGTYDEYFIHDGTVDSILWRFPTMIILHPGYNASSHIFIWRMFNEINLDEYESIVIYWGAWVFEPDSFMTDYPQFNIISDEKTDLYAPDSVGFVAISKQTADFENKLPSPNDIGRESEITFHYPEYEEIEDGIYLTVVRPKNKVVIFGVRIKGIYK